MGAFGAMPRLLPALIVAVASALAIPAGALASTDWLSLRTMNISHQGGENEAPSATMYAFERSMRLGADMLEVDIHTTADGAVVILHDGDVDRTTDGGGSVYEMTLEEIQALDAAYNFVPGEGTVSDRPLDSYPFRGVRTGDRKPPPGAEPDDFGPPTLEEVMAAYPTVPINIEIKGAADTDVGSFMRNAESLAELLNRLGRSDGIIVASFNDLALAHFHSLAPQIDLAPATGAVAAYTAARVPPPAGSVAFQVPITFAGVTVTDAQFVRNAHEDGYAVHVWLSGQAENEAVYEQLLGWGVDGIMAAEPGRLEGVLCELGIPRPPRPDSFGGRHCSERVSIACAVSAEGAAQSRGKLTVTLRRSDEFAGRCAGRVVLRVPGAGGRAVGRFEFGKLPPSGGGPAETAVKLHAPRRLGPAIADGVPVQVATRPYGAFVDRARLKLR